jgi:hypothetical protein
MQQRFTRVQMIAEQLTPQKSRLAKTGESSGGVLKRSIYSSNYELAKRQAEIGVINGPMHRPPLATVNNSGNDAGND